MPHHILLDCLREQSRSGAVPVGTTLRGYRPGLRRQSRQARRTRRGFIESRPPNRARARAVRVLSAVCRLARRDPSGIPQQVVDEYAAKGECLRCYVADTVELLHLAIDGGRRISLEGAQGALLDVDHGTYPYVTSSNTIAGAASAGAGIGPDGLQRCIGRRQSLLHSRRLWTLPHRGTRRARRETSKSGRRVRLDNGAAPAVWLVRRRAGAANGSNFGRDSAGGDQARRSFRVGRNPRLPRIPQRNFLRRFLGAVQPVYRSLPGWREDLSSARCLADLPRAAREYLDALAEAVGCPLGLVSAGVWARADVRASGSFRSNALAGRLRPLSCTARATPRP